MDTEDRICAICVDYVVNDQSKTTTKCYHSFHSQCLQTWLTDNTTCPMCRMRIVVEPFSSIELYNLIDSGSLEAVIKYLDDTHATLQDIRLYDSAALRYATSNGYLDIIQYFIEQREFNLYEIQDQCRNVLGVAAANGHLHVVKYFIDECGLSVDHIRSGDNDVLRWATHIGHLEMVQYLISKGLTVDDIHNVDGIFCESAFSHSIIQQHQHITTFFEKFIAANSKKK